MFRIDSHTIERKILQQLYHGRHHSNSKMASSTLENLPLPLLLTTLVPAIDVVALTDNNNCMMITGGYRVPHLFV
jgi:hypothetical protein